MVDYKTEEAAKKNRYKVKTWKRTLRFGGKKYTFLRTHVNKSDAEKGAEILRKRGLSVRVVSKTVFRKDFRTDKVGRHGIYTRD